MRVLVCGSRDLRDHVKVNYELGKINFGEDINFETIIHGGARGVDTLAGIYAKMFGIKTEVFPANWDEHGKAAGPIRNQQMLDEGKPDLVIAFLAEGSKGTKDMIDRATKANIPTKVINI